MTAGGLHNSFSELGKQIQFQSSSVVTSSSVAAGTSVTTTSPSSLSNGASVCSIDPHNSLGPSNRFYTVDPTHYCADLSPSVDNPSVAPEATCEWPTEEELHNPSLGEPLVSPSHPDTEYPTTAPSSPPGSAQHTLSKCLK